RPPTTRPALGRRGPLVLYIPSAPRRGPMRSLHPDDPEYLGGFRLVARLGSNTAGTVHLGVDGDGHPAAVTAVRPECVTAPGFTARLAHETETAPRVQSRFVPQPLGYDLTTPEPWSAVEYVVGPS